MEKVLIISDFALGDCVACTLVLAKKLAETARVYCTTSTMSSYRLLREMPFFYCVTHSGNHGVETGFDSDLSIYIEKYTDLAKHFAFYDKVYVARCSLREKMQELLDQTLVKNVFNPEKIDFASKPPMSRSEMLACRFGVNNPNYSIDINWYNKYHFDFNCRSNTVLFNGKSDATVRNYKRNDEVVSLLQNSGFDVRQFDFNTDIRTNMHLINQAKHILTTDTSTYWLAKAMGKMPHVFISNNMYSNAVSEQLLGCQNIIENKGDIDKTEPQEIIDGFLKTQISLGKHRTRLFL